MRELEEAQAWLMGARYLVETRDGRGRFTVAVAMSIHSMIRANDALTMKFLRRRSTRHEDAGMLFGELIRQKKIDPKYAKLRRVLATSISKKSEYDYKGAEVGKERALKHVREAETFISAVEEILGVI